MEQLNILKKDYLNNMKKETDSFKLVELISQYKVLSEIEEMFPRNSTHRVAKYADKRMREILREIEVEVGVKIKDN